MSNCLTINTGFMPFSPIELRLEWIKDSGFEGVVLSEDDSRELIKNEEFAQNFFKTCEALGLKIQGLMGCHLDAPNAIDVLTKCIEFAYQYEIPTVITCPFRGFETFESKLSEKIEAGMITTQALIPVLKSRQLSNGESVVLAIENRHPSFMMAYYGGVFERIQDPLIGIAYDVSNDQFDGPRTFELLETFVDRVKMIQISDRSESYVSHQLPGEGYVFFAEICRILRQSQYNGILAVNSRMEHSYIKAPQPFLIQAYRTLKNIEKQVRPPSKGV